MRQKSAVLKSYIVMVVIWIGIIWQPLKFYLSFLSKNICVHFLGAIWGKLGYFIVTPGHTEGDQYDILPPSSLRVLNRVMT